MFIMKHDQDDNGFEHTIKTNGVHAFVLHVKDGGQKITLSGWCCEHRMIDKGERVLVVTDEHPEGSRYIVEDNDCPRDPPDQYFMRLKFLPRTRV